jgi:hypothetical protein
MGSGSRPESAVRRTAPVELVLLKELVIVLAAAPVTISQ